MKKILILLLLLISIPLVKAEETEDLAPNAKSAIMIEASTGEILFQKNKDETVSNISYQIDEIIPIVVLRGDKISSKARKMQEDWLKKNKPTRSVYGQP